MLISIDTDNYFFCFKENKNPAKSGKKNFFKITGFCFKEKIKTRLNLLRTVRSFVP